MTYFLAKKASLAEIIAKNDYADKLKTEWRMRRPTLISDGQSVAARAMRPKLPYTKHI